MAAFKVLALVLLAGTVCSAVPHRIAGGDPTTIDRYPSIVQLDSLGIFSNTWSQACAANILNSRNVVTAAQCVYGWTYTGPHTRRIRAGATYRNSGGILYNIVQEYNHPSYSSISNDGDISVIRLESSLTYTPVVQQAIIAAQGTELPDNTPVVLAGWGATAQDGLSSPVLQDVTIYTVNREFCRSRHLSAATPMNVTENMVCAGVLDVGGKDACQGDFGGPLYYGDIVVGIVSWGSGCADDVFPSVSTRIGSYTDWILSIAN